MKMMKQKDIRVKKMNELLQGMKILKLYAWEESFMSEIETIRNGEISTMLKMAYLNSGTAFVWSCAPFVVSLVSFGTYVLASEDNVLDSQKAFTSLALFNILRFPLSMLPMMITSAIQASVSFKRINRFMRNFELDPENVTKESNKKKDTAVVVTDGNFHWDESTFEIEDNSKKDKKNGKKDAKNGDVKPKGDENGIVEDDENTKMINGDAQDTKEKESFKLNDINLSIKKGKLCAVVGTVGSGKSSFLSALLGEMDKISGNVEVNGKVAYVSQQAWIQNATLKDNIIFSIEEISKIMHI